MPLGSGPYITWNKPQYEALQNDSPSTTDVILHDKNADGDDKVYNLKTACLSLDFWLIFAIFFLGVGSGITLVNSKLLDNSSTCADMLVLTDHTDRSSGNRNLANWGTVLQHHGDEQRVASQQGPVKPAGSRKAVLTRMAPSWI